MKSNKVLISMIVAIVTLVMLTVGATYAYFAVSSTYNFSATATATTPSVGSVALSSGTSISMALTRAQMMKQTSNTTYYASSNGATTTETTVNIAQAKVTGEGTYSCDYTLNVAYSSSTTAKSMKAALGAAGWAVLTVNGTAYDVYSTTFPKTISGTLTGITASAAKNITAQLKIINLTGTDQTAMADKDMTFTFTATAFTCTATA